MQFIRLFATLLAFGQSYRHVVRFNHWSLTSHMVLAATSTLASPIAANSLSREVYLKRSVVVREPESQDSKLEALKPIEDIYSPKLCER